MEEIINQKADKLINMIKKEYDFKINKDAFFDGIDKSYDVWVNVEGDKYKVVIDVCEDGYYLSTLNLDRYKYYEEWEDKYKNQAVRKTLKSAFKYVKKYLDEY